MKSPDPGASVRVPVERWWTGVEGLFAWMRERDYRGWDPFDLLASPVVRFLTLGSRWLAVAWVQLGRRSPVQLRPLLGVPRTRNPKALALVLSGLARLPDEPWPSAGDLPAPRDEARTLLRALLELQRPEGGWGYPFPWANRAFQVPAHTPAGVPTAFVTHALLDAAERWPGLDGAPGVDDAVSEAAGFCSHHLQRVPGPEGTFSFSYTPRDRRVVHNANALVASILARVGRRLADGDLMELGLRAARFTARVQKNDGAWPYGSGPRDGWVDSYHTGYLLWALDLTGRAADTHEFQETVRRGLRYWRSAFFQGPGVSLRPGRPYPVDMHAVAQAILTALHFRDELDDGGALARELGSWSLRHMRAPTGRFHYRKHRLVTNRIPYMRWVQAWAFRAFCELARVESGRGG